MASPFHPSHPLVPPVAALPPVERVQSIVTLLTKAILLADAKRALAIPAESDSLTEAVDSNEDRILRFLQVSGYGSPAVIRRALGLPKTTAYRALLRLTENGAVIATGQTRTLAYKLTEQEPPAATIARN